jgi:hypothetical protein
MPAARDEHAAWVLLCASLQRMGCVSEKIMLCPPGMAPAFATDRENDECNLMDLIRTWGDALAKLRVEEAKDNSE